MKTIVNVSISISSLIGGKEMNYCFMFNSFASYIYSIQEKREREIERERESEEKTECNKSILDDKLISDTCPSSKRNDLLTIWNEWISCYHNCSNSNDHL